MRARICVRYTNLSVIQCYVPTNDADDDVKEHLYNTLQAEMAKIPKQDLLLVTGDMNAKVLTKNNNYEREIGRYGCGIMNSNGEMLVDFRSANNLVIGDTLFPHKTIHKLTCCSPNGRDKNQIDHLLINGKWRGSLREVWRGADVASDHHLVTATE